MKKIFTVAVFIVSTLVIFLATSKINANDDVKVLLQSATEKITSGEFVAAAEEFEKVISLDKNNSNAYSGLGTVYAKQGKKEQAEQYFDRAISLDENNIIAYIGLGYANLNKGNLDESVKLFKKAVSLDDKNPHGYEGLVRAYASYKDKDCKTEILSNLAVLEKIDPKLAETLSNKLNLK